MRELFGILAVGALLLGTGTASAAPVNTTATLAIQIQNVGALPVTGSGEVSVTGTTVTVPANLVQQGDPIVIPVTSITAVQSLTATGIANLAGTFRMGGVTSQAPAETCPATLALGVACNTGGNVGGVMALTGFINIRVNEFVNVAVNLNTAGIGQGGTFTTPQESISGDNAVWSTGVGKVGATTTTTITAFVLGGQVTNTNTFTTTFTSQGQANPFQVVTPTFVNAFGGLAQIPLFSTLTLDSVTVPQPDTLLLLASGIAGLALVGWLRK